jgi:hypothetical protein
MPVWTATGTSSSSARAMYGSNGSSLRVRPAYCAVTSPRTSSSPRKNRRRSSSIGGRGMSSDPRIPAPAMKSPGAQAPQAIGTDKRSPDPALTTPFTML